MNSTKRQPVLLKDYTPPSHLIDDIELRFELGEESTTVLSSLSIRRNPQSDRNDGVLWLNGAGQPLISIELDGEPVAEQRYQCDAQGLRLSDVPERFVLTLQTRLKPQENTSLEGLYRSSGTFCTQCEAEGFRKITWFTDRPDVMSRYRTTIVTEPGRYPVVLCNGNRIERGQQSDGRTFVVYEDPFPKPSYLFALVAGDLACIEDHYTTLSGREVTLQIYVEHHNRERCDHAMSALRKAMQWDEQNYGLEYDLDSYMIVAVDDFNMGAMENKGLNIFNSKYVLASPQTATDDDFANIEGVIAHEYFHNWTGNRVTCRDWFQLSLKEGLTVFRDQEFSADVGSRAVKRIHDVRVLRTYQFAEDGGPMAHPVRPDSYIEISNFYTVTVYNKGAEVIRMIHTLLGQEGFEQGMSLYFQRHDGQAVTIEDFVAAMEEATGTDLVQFRNWYSQAGTPEVEIQLAYDSSRGSAVLELAQRCPDTPGQSDKAPFHIPLRIALFDENGHKLPLLQDETTQTPSEAPALDGDLLHVRKPYERLHLKGLPVAAIRPPLISAGRGFSAPIHIKLARDDEELAFLMARDDDPFNRWDAAQTLALNLINTLVADHRQGRSMHLPQPFVDAFAKTLNDQSTDKALIAEALRLPGESYVADQMLLIDVDSIHTVREFIRHRLADALQEQFYAVMHSLSDNTQYRFETESVGRRALKNLCLSYLMTLQTTDIRNTALDQLQKADNMTDALAALACFANTQCPERADALSGFEQRWRNEPLVMDKWFSLQAISILPDTLDSVQSLLEHPRFDLKNPNRIRALIGSFAHGNQVRFNDVSGRGYEFLADKVLELDPVNPQIAARLLGAFSRISRFDPARKTLMRSQLERIAASSGLSKDCYEVASKTLNNS